MGLASNRRVAVAVDQPVARQASSLAVASSDSAAVDPAAAELLYGQGETEEAGRQARCQTLDSTCRCS